MDGIYYNLSEESLGNFAEVTSRGQEQNGYSGNVVVPDVINYSGKTYNVTSIKYSALGDCKNLSHVYSLNPMPPVCDASAFTWDDSYMCTLHVPQGSNNRYEDSEGWQKFTTILDDLPSKK